MKKITALKSTFSSLLSNDFSSISTISYYEQSDVKLFLNGRFYNETPDSFLTKYILTGRTILKTVDGDFTLIIIDAGKIYIFRDRHGVGSQVFYSADFFTSNLLDFTELTGFECKPNIEALFTFLSIGYVPSPLCSLEGVKKLGAGHLLTVDKTTQTVTDIFPASGDSPIGPNVRLVKIKIVNPKDIPMPASEKAIFQEWLFQEAFAQP